MPAPPKPIPPELLLEARRLYEETRVPVDDICALLGIGARTFYTRLRRWNWRRRITRIPLDSPLPPPPAPQSPLPYVSPTPLQQAPPAESGAAGFAGSLARIRDEDAPLAVRVQRAVERELAAIERIVATLRPGSSDMGEAERAARTLASLARTLQEVMRLDRPPEKAEHADDVPQDLDELRKALSRKLEALVASQQGEDAGGDDGA